MRAAVALSLLLAGGVAAAHPRRFPSRQELGNAVSALDASIAILREQLKARGDDHQIEERLAAIEKRLAEVSDSGDADARLGEVAAALETLKEDAATHDDLRRYQRKPDEKSFKSRIAQELELRGAWTDLRQGQIREDVANLGLLAMDPGASPRTRALVQKIAGLGDLLLANDARPRPRLLLRLTWETSRFLDDKTYLFLSATPELQLYAYDDDLDRALLPRDVAAPRDRLGLIIKKAAAGVSNGRFSLQAGVLQFTYGAGFFTNPTNVFTPKSPLDPRREVDGVPAARADLGLVQREGLTLTAQLAAVGDRVRNDVLGDWHDKLGVGGLALVRLDTSLFSLTGLGLYQRPDAAGASGPAAGGILSTNPFGLTASVEALVTEGPYGGSWRPQLVASLQGFTSRLASGGTTYVLEYFFDGQAPASTAEASADVVRAVERERSLLAVDLLTRPLGRRHYANLYVEPALTQKLRVNGAVLMGFDEAPGAILRAGFDYALFNFTVHAFGGALVGAEGSELSRHLMRAFAEMAVMGTF